jgi:hypothetical protein
LLVTGITRLKLSRPFLSQKGEIRISNQHWTYFRKVLSFTTDCWGRVVGGNITTTQVWRRTHLEEYVKMCNKFASQLPQHTEAWSPLVFTLWVGNHTMLIHLLHPIAHFFFLFKLLPS